MAGLRGDVESADREYAPKRMGDAIGGYALEWIEGVRYVEDIEVIPGTPWLVAAGMSLPIDRAGGRLYLVDTDAGALTRGGPTAVTTSPRTHSRSRRLSIPTSSVLTA